jgi:hypothetical protein
MYNDIRSFVNLSGNSIIGLDYLVFCDSPIQYRTEHFENRTFRKPDVLKPDVLKPDDLKPNVLKPNVLKPGVLKPGHLWVYRKCRLLCFLLCIVMKKTHVAICSVFVV